MRHLGRIFLTLIFCLSTSFLFAGLNDPGTDPCVDPDAPICACPSNANIPPCPIDGGVVALLAAGIGLGLKRVHDVRKSDSATDKIV